MGEIKSTLDLVLEKTRHLSLSREERAAQQSAEMEKRVDGLLMKYREGTIKKDRFFQALDALRGGDGASVDSVVKHAMLKRVGLDPDDGVWLELLNTVYGVDTKPLAAVISDYQAVIRKSEITWSRKSLTRLQDKYQVTGTAIVANLEADPEWNRKHKEIETEFGRRLENEKAAGF